jgi:diguanylate cyclase (GGDEF)-like protein/PAS domain S-box-containing protein
MLLGGGGIVAPHWFYIPIFMAGLRFGPFGAILAGGIALVVAGPLLPDHFTNGVAFPQAMSDWVSRGIFFIVIGVFVTLLFGAVRSLSAQEARLIEERAVREAQADTLRESEQRFRSLIQRASDMILVVDTEGTILSESSAVKRMLGWDSGERLGRGIVNYVHADDAQRAMEAIQGIVKGSGTSCTVELRQRDASGRWHWVESTISNMLDEPTVRGVVINDRIVDDRKVLEVELIHRASHDSLTGLANRDLLREHLNSLLVQRREGGREATLLYIDIDEFKKVNDGFGHAEGDRLLVEIAQRLTACAGAQDLVARIGGDEFAVVTTEHQENHATSRALAERILTALDRPWEKGSNGSGVGASIGLATSANGNADTDMLLRQADVAMYSAKVSGKCRFAMFSDDMDEFFRQGAKARENAGLERRVSTHA